MKKVVLITGASSGIGRESVLKYLEKDCKVYAAARRVELMDDLKQKGAEIIKMDVTDEESVTLGIENILSKDGKIDILVNNAGYGSYGAVEDIPLDEAKRQFEVNIFGLAKLVQLVLPSMRNQKSGKIINVSSIGGKIYSQFGAWYHATKHALEGFSDCLRLELKPFNVDVVLIQPGLIQTEWGDIAIEKLQKVSGDGAYKSDCERVSGTMKKMYATTGSHPSVVAKTILKAGMAKRPKTRYAVGQFAKPFLFLRNILTDRQFDSLSRIIN